MQEALAFAYPLYIGLLESAARIIVLLTKESIGAIPTPSLNEERPKHN
jgi:hypothetical protein